MDQAADIMRLGMFSARALPVVSLCHIVLPGGIQPYVESVAARMKHFLQVIITGSISV